MSGPEVVPGQPARDPDGDGLYEDVNGDGDVAMGDATVLFNAIFEGRAAVMNNAEKFDFNGDGEVTVGDANVLADRIFNGTATEPDPSGSNEAFAGGGFEMVRRVVEATSESAISTADLREAGAVVELQHDNLVQILVPNDQIGAVESLSWVNRVRETREAIPAGTGSSSTDDSTSDSNTAASRLSGVTHRIGSNPSPTSGVAGADVDLDAVTLVLLAATVAVVLLGRRA